MLKKKNLKRDFHYLTVHQNQNQNQKIKQNRKKKVEEKIKSLKNVELLDLDLNVKINFQNPLSNNLFF